MAPLGWKRSGKRNRIPSDWSFVSVDMELTNHQLSSECLMCPHEFIIRTKGMMSEDVYNIVSDKLIREGSLITFSGMGDPLSHPRVFEWTSDFRNKSCDVGIMINPESLNEGITHQLIESHPNSITVSFQSIQKDVFEKLCLMISFKDALKRTLELTGLSCGKVGLRIAGIMTEINSDEQKEYVRFWKERGIRADMTVCHGRGGNCMIRKCISLKHLGWTPEDVAYFNFTLLLHGKRMYLRVVAT